MKFLHLIVNNLASIETADLDFASPPLSQCPLFLINGDTGSGKSTLLDAICLALFGETPRLGVAGQESYILDTDEDKGEVIKAKDARQYLRRGAVEGSATFEFEGNDGHRYRAMWSVRRARLKPDGKIQDSEHTLEDLDGGSVLSRKREVVARVTQVIGLTYEQFLRTTILAQGEFARFLRSNANEKSEILEKITGTTIYTALGKKIYEKTTALKRELDDLTARVADMVLLSEEDRTELERQKSQAAEDYQKAQAVVKTCNEHIGWLNSRAEEQAAMQRLDDELGHLRATWLDLWGGSLHLEASCEAADGEIGRREQALSPYRQRADALEHAGELTAHCGHILQLWDKMAQSRKLLGELEQQLPAQADKINQAAEILSEPADGLTVTRLDRLDEALTRQDKLLQQLTKTYQAWDNARAECRLAKQTLDEAVEAVEADTAAVEPLQTALEKARSAEQVARTMFEKLELSLSDTINEARSRLSPGDICPLCGQEVTTCWDNGHFESLLAPQREERDKARQLLNKAEAAWLSHEKLSREHRQRLTQVEAKHRQRQSTLENCLKDLQQACIDDGAPFDEATFNLDAVAGRQQQCAQRQSAVRQARGARQALELARQEINQHNETIAQAKGDVAKATELVNRHAPEADWLERLADQRAAYCEQLTRDARYFTDEKAALETMRQTVVDNRNIIGRVRELLNGLTERLGTIEGTPEAAGHKQLADEVEALREHVVSWDTERKEHNKRLDDLTRRIDTLPPDVTLDTLRQQVADAEARSQQLQQNIGSLTRQLDDDRKAHDRHADQLAVIADRKTEHGRWAQLNSLLGSAQGDLMRNVALSFVLEDLLHRANAYLRQFSDHYSLTCDPGSLGILVNDHYNGMIRCGFAMLSGGETFMVSLALALALAQVNADGRTGVDMLFIDEGFGSLGDNSLNMVMDTLERLHDMGHGRVGIISHMAGLDERIATQVRVRRLDNARSSVTVVG